MDRQAPNVLPVCEKGVGGPARLDHEIVESGLPSGVRVDLEQPVDGPLRLHDQVREQVVFPRGSCGRKPCT